MSSILFNIACKFLKSYYNTLMIISFHIEKSGGTSLQLYLRNFFGSRFYQFHIRESEKCLDHLRSVWHLYSCIHGHQFYGVHNIVNQKCNYITVLRHPYERFISHAYHVKVFEKTGYELDTFIEKRIDCQNLLTRRLCNKEFEPLTETDYALAKERLQGFQVIGFIDNLPAFARQCCGRFGTPFEFPYVDNGSGCLKLYTELDPETVLKIHELNLFDIRLYEWARGSRVAELIQTS